MNAKQWYEYWSANCQWCRKDGRCAEQDKRKAGDSKARCAQFEDVNRKDKKR